MNMHYQKLMKFGSDTTEKTEKEEMELTDSYMQLGHVMDIHPFVIICIHCKSILLQITHHINGTAQKYSLFILAGKYLQILDIFYGLLLHNKADQCHHNKTAHVL
jgi:hypothetical protein